MPESFIETNFDQIDSETYADDYEQHRNNENGKSSADADPKVAAIYYPKVEKTDKEKRKTLAPLNSRQQVKSVIKELQGEELSVDEIIEILGEDCNITPALKSFIANQIAAAQGR